MTQDFDVVTQNYESHNLIVAIKIFMSRQIIDNEKQNNVATMDFQANKCRDN